MPAMLRIVDECFGSGAGERRPALELRLVSERITARDLIRRRVAEEVAEANRKRDEFATAHARTRSFLIPLGADSPEARLNLPGTMRRRRHFDHAGECDRALEAFRKNQFILLFDERQIAELDEEIAVGPDSEVVFLYLTPLIGG